MMLTQRWHKVALAIFAASWSGMLVPPTLLLLLR